LKNGDTATSGPSDPIEPGCAPADDHGTGGHFGISRIEPARGRLTPPPRAFPDPLRL